MDWPRLQELKSATTCSDRTNPARKKFLGGPRMRWKDVIKKKDVKKMGDISNRKNLALDRERNLFARRDGLKGLINLRKKKKKISSSIAHLFVIQFSGQGEGSCVWIDIEHIIGPVADHRVRNHTIGALVFVRSQNVTDLRAPGRRFAYVQREHALDERRRVVVGVQNLRKTSVKYAKSVG